MLQWRFGKALVTSTKLINAAKYAKKLHYKYATALVINVHWDGIMHACS